MEGSDANKLRQLANDVRVEWQRMGITAEVCHISDETYEENIARSVLEREDIARTDTNIVHVLNIMHNK